MKAIVGIVLFVSAVSSFAVGQEPEASVDVLERSLASEDFEVRYEAQNRLLGGAYREADPQALVSMLVRRLGTPIPEGWDGLPLLRDETTFRGRLIEHLATHYTAQDDVILPEVLEILADVSNSAYLRGTAAVALERIGSKSPEVVAALIAAIEDPRPRTSTGVHDRAAHALGSMGAASVSAVPALNRLLAHPFGLVQDEAFVALGRIFADGSNRALADHLELGHRIDELDAGEASATLLALMASPEESRSVVPSLVGLLETRGDDYLQRAALRLLAEIGPEATPQLMAALLDAMLEDRSREAEAALLRIEPDGPASVAPLAKAMGSLLANEQAEASWPQRVVMARTVARFGQDGAAALPVLVEGVQVGASRLELHQAAREEFSAHASALAAVGVGDAAVAESAGESVLGAMDAVADGEFAAWGRTRLLEIFVGVRMPVREPYRVKILGRIHAALESFDADAKQVAGAVICARAHELDIAEAAPLVSLLASALDVDVAPQTIPALVSLGALSAPALPRLEAIAGEELPTLFTNHRERERQRMAREAIKEIRAALLPK